MTLLVAGSVGFGIGLVMILTGRAMAARERRHHRQLEKGDLLQPFLEWLLEVFKKEWPLLTGADSRPGERVAAAGSLLSAVSLIAIVGGIVTLVLQSVPK